MLQALRFLGWPTLVGVLAALLIIQRYPHWFGIDHEAGPSPNTAPFFANNRPHSYAAAVASAAPSVVNLYTAKRTGDERGQSTPERSAGEALQRERRVESSLGSAVIMTRDGYLLTNDHVTSNAEQIIVALRDGRETLARVIGRDPETDLAVLKIELGELPAIRIGRSDDVHVGDVALAIGNPFGVGQTVTMGIISATGRNQLGLNTYEDFIQTDAAINRGNSGGALVDASGQLVGINTAILSESGGSQGIGFAIPAKLALEVMQAIIDHGQVIRGWLGVEVQSLTPDLARSYGLEGRQGIVVVSVYEDGPAQRAGLQPGDLVVSIDEADASDGRNAMNQVARARPGQTVRIAIIRNGSPMTLSALVGMRPLIGAP